MIIPVTKSDDYWAGLYYLMKKHKPVSLAEVLQLVSVVENYMARHTAGDLSQQLLNK